jgi:hypothetical protein
MYRGTILGDEVGICLSVWTPSSLVRIPLSSIVRLRVRPVMDFGVDVALIDDFRKIHTQINKVVSNNSHAPSIPT